MNTNLTQINYKKMYIKINRKNNKKKKKIDIKLLIK